jgi:hypothetical protein
MRRDFFNEIHVTHRPLKSLLATYHADCKNLKKKFKLMKRR